MGRKGSRGAPGFLRAVLAQDPRPAYQQDSDRVYGFPFAGLEVHFTVVGDVLTVCGIFLPKKHERFVKRTAGALLFPRPFGYDEHGIESAVDR